MTDPKHDAKHEPKQDHAAPRIPPEQIVAPPVDSFIVDGKQIVAVLGPYQGATLTLPIAQADQAIADHWAIEPRYSVDDEAPPVTNLTPAEREAAEAAAATWAATVAGTAPVIDALAPPNALAGGPDVPMTVTGSGFVSGCVVVFDGADLPTTFVDTTSVTTTVIASTAVPGMAPVAVRNSNGAISNEINFALTATREKETGADRQTTRGHSTRATR